LRQELLSCAAQPGRGIAHQWGFAADSRNSIRARAREWPGEAPSFEEIDVLEVCGPKRAGGFTNHEPARPGAVNLIG